MRTILLLLASNVFMTFAWYRHLKAEHAAPLWIAVLSSWGIAFFEYRALCAIHFATYELKTSI